MSDPVKCPECGHDMQHVEFVEGKQLECWQCENCGAVMDVSDVEIEVQEES